jgi:hypothetical protein
VVRPSTLVGRERRSSRSFHCALFVVEFIFLMVEFYCVLLGFIVWPSFSLVVEFLLFVAESCWYMGRMPLSESERAC